MSEENKALVRRAWEEVFDQGNLDAVNRYFASDYINYDPAAPAPRRGPEDLKQFVSVFYTAFPDLRVTIEDLIAEGDKVVVRWTASGTHQGEFQGIAPTGNWVRITGITIERLADDKIVETWDNYDALGMMQQLGVVPR